MLKEFKAFIMRGSVLDLAVGIIIGAAFGKIVSSFVADILMPPVGLVLGGMDFSNLFLSLNGQQFASLAAAQEAGAPTLNYGLFLNNIIDFVIVGLAMFLVIKAVNRFQAPKAAPAVTTKECPCCCTNIPLKATRCPNCTTELAGFMKSQPVLVK